ncbi:MAG: DUF4844 domain-containing protein [Cytophagales bacterium]|nr:DUF4844 domain-containing protein [Cytophagales bacterium]
MNKITKELKDFLEKDKFSPSEWEGRGLNPSSYERCLQMAGLINDCCKRLIEHAERNGKAKVFKRELIDSLNTFKKARYDTEEKEFIGDYFIELSRIVDVAFEDDLNKWLYGSYLQGIKKIASLFKGAVNVVETLSQDCTRCGARLETFITKRRDGIPDYAFDIVKCKACGELNMLDKGPGVHSLRFGEYELVEQLLKTEYTEEQARIRMEQIRYFRK